MQNTPYMISLEARIKQAVFRPIKKAAENGDSFDNVFDDVLKEIKKIVFQSYCNGYNKTVKTFPKKYNKEKHG